MSDAPTGSPPAPPSEPPARPPRQRRDSLVLVLTGDGKGKSSSAFGTALRAVARGRRVGVVQLLKSGDWHVGEEDVCRRLGMDWYAAGDGFTWDSTDLDETRAKAVAACAFAAELLAAGRHDLVVLDEVTYPMVWGWVPVEEVVAAVRHRAPHVNVILTGRDCPAELMDLADTVSEVRKVKHAFDEGVLAVRGLDY